MTTLLEQVTEQLERISADLDDRITAGVRAAMERTLPPVFGVDDWDTFTKLAQATDARKFFSGAPDPLPNPTQILAGTPYQGRDQADVEFAYHVLRQHNKVVQWDRERHEQIITAMRADDGAWLRAMDSAEAGFGLEFVGTQYVSQLFDAARAAYRIAGLFQFIDMTAPSAVLPTEAGIPEMLFVGESTANNSSNYGTSKTGTAKVTLNAKKFVIHQMWSGEIEEDSIIPWVPFLRQQLAKAVAHYTDSLLLNGDTTNAATGNINLDDADPADTKHYLALDGIRHNGLVDNTANSKDIAGPLTPTEVLLARGRMRNTTNFFDWGLDPAECALIVDFDTYVRMVDFDEVVTVDKLGPQASIVTGQVASLWGIPVVYSPTMSKTEADGKVSTTGANNTKGQAVLVARQGWIGGYRRRLAVEFERIPATDQSRLVASTRIGFENYDTEVSDVMYNLTV